MALGATAWKLWTYLPVVPASPPVIYTSLDPLQTTWSTKQFATDHDMKQAVFPWLQKFYTDFLYTGILALASQWDKCLNICGDYVEVWRVPYNIHIPSKLQ